MRDPLDARLRRDGAAFRRQSRSASNPSPRPRLAPVAAAVLLAVTLSAAVFAVAGRTDEAPEVLAAAPVRERAVLAQPYLVAAGTLPSRPAQSVRDVPVPFTFRTPPQVGVEPWGYRVGEVFELGDVVSGLTLLAPTATYDPRQPWTTQSALTAAPTDAAGWSAWLEQTGQVRIVDRQALLIGGALATRFTVELQPLSAAYSGCGGGRSCVALLPVTDPSIGPARVGAGAQAGLDELTRELTVIELEGRAVLAVAGATADAAPVSMPALRAVVDSARFA